MNVGKGRNGHCGFRGLLMSLIEFKPLEHGASPDVRNYADIRRDHRLLPGPESTIIFIMYSTQRLEQQDSLDG